MQLNADLALFDALDEGVVAVDRGSTIVFVNAAAERMFDYAAADLVGRPLELLIPEASRSRHRRHVEGFRDAGATARMMRDRSGIRGRRRDGSVFDVEASITRSTVGGETVLVAVIRDVTERKAAEARVLESEQHLRAILETCTDAILVADTETGMILEVNERAAELFGCATAELIGLHQSELHPAEDREKFRQTFREHIETGRILVPDATIQRRNGAVVPVEIAARPARIGGRATLVGFFRDITHRKEHERLLVEAREAATAANRSKTTFLANISHELRTPLNAIIGLSEMIAGGFFGPVGHPKYTEYANDIRDSGSHLLDLINDILDLSRIELGKAELSDDDLDLDEEIDQCWRTVRQLIDESGLGCSRRIAPRVRRLRADRRAVRQMLLNLLSNAIKHTPAGGRIEIAAEPTADGGIALSVSDTGVGIAPERLADVTTPFNAANDKGVNNLGGTGLGLAITKGLVERHGGRFEIASRLGAGTTVRLNFPAERVPAAED